MKKKFGLIVTVVIVLVVLFLGYKKINWKKEEVIVEIGPKHPYGIESLNSHVINGIVTVEKKYFDQESFSSYRISFYSDLLKEYGLMNIPSGTKPENGWPVIVLNHGFVAPKSYSTTESYKNTAAYLASKGFLVLKADYRSHDDSEGAIDSLYSRNEYAVDVLNLIAAIKSIPEANTNRIYLYGHSMGGDISLMVAENTDRVKKMVLWAPAVTTYPQNLVFFTRRHGDKLDKPEAQKEFTSLIGIYGAESFSSFSNLDKIKIPVLIQHGMTDESVPYLWGKQLAEKIQSLGKNVTFISYENDNHDLAKHWYEALNKDIEFFNQN